MGDVDLTNTSPFDYPYTDSLSSPFIDNSELTAVCVVSADSRRSQLVANGWPQHLPELEITRHLYVIFHVLSHD